MRIGVLTTHPIQYQVPWFRLLSAQLDIDLEVMYCMMPDAAQQGDGFGVDFEWDIPLLDGYNHRILENVSAQPSVTQFGGCDTPDIFNVIRDESWDAFIVNGWVAKSCLQLLAACRRYQVPCIVRGEANLLRTRPLWKQLIQRALVHQYSAFLSIGKANKAFYQHHGIAAERIFDTPYCIENERFSVQSDRIQPQRPQLRRKFGLSTETFTFLYCGKFVAKKRPLDLLQALAQLKKTETVNIQLLMVGDGDLRAACEAFATKEDLPVKFSGFLNQKEIVEAYAVSDCLLLPSDHGETWGLVVNEAMACGLPAIVSDQVGCHLNLIQPGETGYVYPMGDIRQLAEQMAQLATSGVLQIQALGENARRQVLQQYNYQKVVVGIQQALHDSLDQKTAYRTHLPDASDTQLYPHNP